MPNLMGDSNNQNTAVFGNNTDGGTGVYGQSISGWGTSGRSETNTGVSGMSTSGTGVVGASRSGIGVSAYSSSNNALYAEGGGVSDVHYPTLIVKQNGSHDLIHGLNRLGYPVFEVSERGGVSISGNMRVRMDIDAGMSISADGHISARFDVSARGVKLTSDKKSKENFLSVNTLEFLENLASMPIHSWNYKDDSSSERHIGPTAQDFKAAFGLNGEDDTRISSTDLHGVALAAIQGLNAKLKAENAQLRANLDKLEARISALESKC